MKQARVKESTLLEKLPQTRLWVEAGINRSCAGKLVRAGYTGVKDLAGASREELQAIGGIGEKTLVILERLLGRPLPQQIPKAVPKAVPRTDPPRLDINLPEEGGIMAGARRLIALARRRQKADSEKRASCNDHRATLTADRAWRR